jgi:hypothetical protein
MVVVWMVSGLVDMPMHVDMVVFAPMDMSMIDLIKNRGCVAEEIPVMGDDDLVKIQPLQDFNEVASRFRIEVISRLIEEKHPGFHCQYSCQCHQLFFTP